MMDTQLNRTTAGQEQSEAALVSALRDGCAGALDEAYRKYHPVMLRTARRYTSNVHAEDVTQDAWLAAVSAIASFEGRSSLKTWLCRIVINKAHNAHRKYYRELPSSPNLTHLSDSSAVHQSMGTAVHLSEPEMAVQRSRVRERIRVEMKNMNRDHANALLLKGMRPLSGPQVSDVLDISPGNLRVILHRARNELAALI